MPFKKLSVSPRAAALIVLAMTVTVTATATFAFPALGFVWVAWCALGYVAIVTVWKEFFIIDRHRDPGAQPDQNRPNPYVLAACVFGVVASVVGIFGMIEVPVLVYGLGFLFIIDRLLKLTVGAE